MRSWQCFLPTGCRIKAAVPWHTATLPLKWQQRERHFFAPLPCNKFALFALHFGVYTQFGIHPRHHLTISFHLKRKIHTCPYCGALTDTVHDYRYQYVKDLPIQGRILFWHYRKRRYVCRCCNKRFYEKNYLLPKYHRITHRLAIYWLQQLSKRRSQKEIANTMGVPPFSLGR